MIVVFTALFCKLAEDESRDRQHTGNAQRQVQADVHGVVGLDGLLAVVRLLEFFQTALRCKQRIEIIAEFLLFLGQSVIGLARILDLLLGFQRDFADGVDQLLDLLGCL